MAADVVFGPSEAASRLLVFLLHLLLLALIIRPRDPRPPPPRRVLEQRVGPAPLINISNERLSGARDMIRAPRRLSSSARASPAWQPLRNC